MTSFLQLAISLAVIITMSKVGGYLSYRIGQPAVLGELLVGILLGPSIIDFLHFSYFTDQHLPEVIHELAEIGVLLLMFIAGLDLHLSDMVHSTKVAALAGTLGVIFPLVLGVITGLLILDEHSIFHLHRFDPRGNKCQYIRPNIDGIKSDSQSSRYQPIGCCSLR